MKLKKLDSQQAFDLISRRQETASPESAKPKNIEDGFGGKSGEVFQGNPTWKRYFLPGTLILAGCVVVSGIVIFHWFPPLHAKPEIVASSPSSGAFAPIGEEEAKMMIEANLRAFLKADSNEERLRYVYNAKDERYSLDVFYSKRGLLDVPLWKTELMRCQRTPEGEIWSVFYRDVGRKKRVITFQRYNDDYLLHWSAMKAFSEMPWEEFIVSRPAGPVLMRGYLRHYGGIWPIGISSDKFHCFLIEDRGGLFSERVIMKTGATGHATLKALPRSGRHPVTVELGYHREENGRKTLRLLSLKHLRWQKLGTGFRLLRNGTTNERATRPHYDFLDLCPSKTTAEARRKPPMAGSGTAERARFQPMASKAWRSSEVTVFV